MQSEKFDVLVLGGGVGGYPAAIRAAQLGKKVALIEKGEMGGTCLNRGCIPSKALIAGGEFVASLKEGDAFGVQVEMKSFDFTKLAAHKDKVVERMRKGLEGLIAANKIQVFKGTGQLTSPREIKVSGQDNCRLTGDKIIIATGSEPRNIAAFPFDNEKILSSTSLLALKKLPKKIAIVGGGVIGCEFASLYNHLGVEVTILELLPRLIATEGKDISDALKTALTKRGVKVETDVKVESIEKKEEGVRILVADGKFFDADCCLVSVGRALNTQNIGLEKAGVVVQDNGLIAVNSQMETSVDGIYAVGDIASKWWLAHVASHQGIVAAENACGHLASMHYNAIPSVIFTNPEIGTVGLSLDEAKKQGYAAKLSPFPFQALGKAQATLHADGFAQLVVEEKTGQILGAQVMGYEASTLIAEITLAITNELTVECIAETIHAHPTFAEVWMESALVALGLPISLPPKTAR